MAALLASAALWAGSGHARAWAPRVSAPISMRLELTEDEWRERLRPEVYRVLHEEGTEPPWSSPLNDVKERGVWKCAGCGAPLFRTEQKFESGSGWPSFWAPAAEDAVERRIDFKLVMPRTEVRCRCCNGHLGHVFSDGPRPTGQRYCINGLALDFVSADVDEALAASADATFESSPALRRAPFASVLPELVLGGALVGGELIGFAVRLGPAAKTPWAAAALDILPPGGPAGTMLLGFGMIVVARNVGLLLNANSERAAE